MKLIIEYLSGANALEIIGLVFGLANVTLLIKKSILNWPAGLVYVIASLILFWNIKLYADFGLHIIYLFLNVYGWYFWVVSKSNNIEHSISTNSRQKNSLFLLFSITGTFVLGFFLSKFTDASLPYWDSATSVFSITGIWLTAKKKLESWYYWFAVDVTAACIYWVKDIPFYSFLYLIYIGMAIVGYYSWKKSVNVSH
ncbi:MAG: nicotinamide riboside transporter PnuC [Bacteroidota bacterium]